MSVPTLAQHTFSEHQGDEVYLLALVVARRAHAVSHKPGRSSIHIYSGALQSLDVFTGSPADVHLLEPRSLKQRRFAGQIDDPSKNTLYFSTVINVDRSDLAMSSSHRSLTPVVFSCMEAALV